MGRARETAELIELIGRERSLTLVGSPGVGKTSLAIQVAMAVQDGYADGVWLVELAGLRDPTLTPDAVAAVLGVREEPGRTLTAMLTEHVATRQLLVVLDNCEHLLDAVAVLVESLLRAGRGVHILATSREALRNEGEVAWRVPPLSVPEPNGSEPTTGPVTVEVQGYEALQLFVERARAALPSFELSDRNARTVAEICRRLDGIPLAIELVAARVGALSVEEIAARLDDRLALSSVGWRTAIPRQQTLRGAIDWSFELLSEEERTLLRRLAVFAGGFTVAAGCWVSGVGGRESGVRNPSAQRSEPEDLELLLRLIERSLVQVETGDGPEQRYRLLEMIRQYGFERLQECGEEAAIRRRHLTWFADFAGRGQEGAHGHDSALWLNRLEADIDNLRAALSWSMSDAEPASTRAGLLMAGALYQFWLFRGHLAEGSRWMEQALAADEAQRARQPASDAPADADEPPAPPRIGAFGAHPRVVVLAELPGLLLQLGRSEQALRTSEEALAVARSVGSLHDEAHALLSLALNLRWIGQYERSVALTEESLVLFRRLGDQFGMWRILRNFGETMIRVGDFERARLLLEEALTAARSLDSPGHVALVQQQLGLLALQSGDLDRAARLLEEARAGWVLLGSAHGMDRVLISLGQVALARQEPRQAASLFAECLTLSRMLSDRRTVARCLVGLVASATLVAGMDGEQQPATLVRLRTAATTLFRQLDADLTPLERPAIETALGVLRERLDSDAFEMAQADGRMLTLGQSIDLGLEVAGQIEAAADRREPTGRASARVPIRVLPPPDRRPAQSQASFLTPRERDVTVLIAEGLTNRQIAARLSISERTVDGHVARILSRLDVATRAQIAVWVTRQGLVRP